MLYLKADMLVYKKILPALFLAVLSAVSANASEWVRIDEGPAEESAKKDFVDMESFRIENGVITFLEKIVNPDGRFAVVRLSINCEKREYRTLEIHTYDDKNNLLNTSSPAGGWRAISPNTRGDTFHFLLCRHGSPIPSGELGYLRTYRENVLEIKSELERH